MRRPAWALSLHDMVPHATPNLSGGIHQMLGTSPTIRHSHSQTTQAGGDSLGISPHTSITMKPQSAFNPPLNVPRSISIQGRGSGTGGGLPHIHGNVVALIEGDAHGVFNVIGLETDALIHQGDEPTGSCTWTFVQSVNGPGPIAIGQAEALLVTVGFGVPRSPGSGPFAATVVIVAEGTIGPPLFEVAISAAA